VTFIDWLDGIGVIIMGIKDNWIDDRPTPYLDQVVSFTRKRFFLINSIWGIIGALTFYSLFT